LLVICSEFLITDQLLCLPLPWQVSVLLCAEGTGLCLTRIHRKANQEGDCDLSLCAACQSLVQTFFHDNCSQSWDGAQGRALPRVEMIS
jgi:hypothetical protein